MIQHFQLLERPYPCRFCEIAFKSTSNRSRHERKAHPVEYQNKKLQGSDEPSSSKGETSVNQAVKIKIEPVEEQPECSRKVSKRG